MAPRTRIGTGGARRRGVDGWNASRGRNRSFEATLEPAAGAILERSRDDVSRIRVVPEIVRYGVDRGLVAGQGVHTVDPAVVQPVGQERLGTGRRGGHAARGDERREERRHERGEAGETELRGHVVMESRRSA